MNPASSGTSPAVSRLIATTAGAGAATAGNFAALAGRNAAAAGRNPAQAGNAPANTDRVAAEAAASRELDAVGVNGQGKNSALTSCQARGRTMQSLAFAFILTVAILI